MIELGQDTYIDPDLPLDNAVPDDSSDHVPRGIVFKAEVSLWKLWQESLLKIDNTNSPTS